MRPDRIYSLVEDRLKAVGAEIKRELEHGVPAISAMGRHVAESGGKRVRPALLCLSASACGYRGELDVRYAAVFELVHTATLVHDDIIDNAALRRGRPVLNRQFGTARAILFGDFLFSKAMEMGVREDDLRIVRLICDAAMSMVEGEIMQAGRNFSAHTSSAEYFDLITRKTANLFSACARAGAVLAGADAAVEKSLARYGLEMGIAFQLIDDYLDYSATREQLGKPVGGDLLEGKITFPVLVLFDKAGRQAVSLVEAIFAKAGRGEGAEGEIAALATLLRDQGALEETKAAAADYANRAISALELPAPSLYLEALRELPRFVVERSN